MFYTKGCVHDVNDCIELINRVVKGEIKIMNRRLKLCEQDLLSPGMIFIYNERTSNIKRWTDKKKWLPSRKIKCFLSYTHQSYKFVKKTYSRVTDSGVYHIIAYSLARWETDKSCCELSSNDFDSLIHSVKIVTDIIQPTHKMFYNEMYYKGQSGVIPQPYFYEQHMYRNNFNLINSNIQNENEIEISRNDSQILRNSMTKSKKNNSLDEFLLENFKNDDIAINSDIMQPRKDNVNNPFMFNSGE
ncbi:WOR1 [Hepatospora eriocheir]|uniref:WOR1 n=1 Tax=Hepatospora eriocheir TaxID=1081669 RepID=A0A1X0QCG8_9MICR|nr:WOR1 [Hepatospora eriocheir]